jgi:hypothetical protein
MSEWLTPRRRTTIGALLAVVALGITAWSLDGAWDARRDAVDARNRAESELADLRVVLDNAHNRIRQAEIERARATAERDGAAVSVQLRRDELAATRTSRDQATDARNTKSAEVVAVRQCISGANVALDALQRRDNAATVAALQLVDAPCRAAQAGGGATPRYGFDFPDPFVLVAGREQYAFATNSGGGNIQVLRRQPDGAWATAGDALGRFPGWAAWGRTWAPSALARPGGYVLYYTVREATTGRQCVSRAVSPTPGGPYVDDSAAPLACGGREALDPEAVVAADGTPVLMWKRERPAAIVAQPLSPDGLALVGTERELLRATQRWQDTNVEAPSMLVTATGSWLFFSSAHWNGGRYATGVVHCAGALGPCDRAAAAPLMESHDRIAGPGGASVFQETPGTFGLAYHAYVSANGSPVPGGGVGWPNPRLLFTATIDLRTGRPVVVE